LHIVAGVIDRRDDEASIGKSCRGCVVGTEPTTATVRDHDEWQFIGHKGTVPYPLNDPASNGCLLLGRAAWIPHRPDQRSTLGVGWHVEEQNASRLGRDGSAPQCDAEQDRR